MKKRQGRPMGLSIGAAAPQPAAMLTAPTALPSGEKTDYSLERWLSWALLFSSLLAAAVLWMLLTRKKGI